MIPWHNIYMEHAKKLWNSLPWDTVKAKNLKWFPKQARKVHAGFWMQGHFQDVIFMAEIPKPQVSGDCKDGDVSMGLSCSCILLYHLMLGTVGSTHCTGCPDLVLQLSSFSSYFARNICCLCINISLAPAAALWQNKSRGVDSQLS